MEPLCFPGELPGARGRALFVDEPTTGLDAFQAPRSFSNTAFTPLVSLLSVYGRLAISQHRLSKRFERGWRNVKSDCRRAVPKKAL